MSNLYVVGCGYSVKFDPRWHTCGLGRRDWAVPFILAATPLVIRLVQSVKRYADSKLITHLINVGFPLLELLNVTNFSLGRKIWFWSNRLSLLFLLETYRYVCNYDGTSRK
jgi:hypothetical protein